MTAFTESEIEILSLDELQKMGFGWVPGANIAPDAADYKASDEKLQYDAPERRGSYAEVVLKHTLEYAIEKLNPALPLHYRPGRWLLKW